MVLLLVTFAALMMGTGFLLVAMMVGQLGRARTVGDDVQPVGAGAAAQTLEPSRSVVDSPEAPAVVRNVPVHPARFLEGCSDADLDAIRDTLGASIGAAARRSSTRETAKGARASTRTPRRSSGQGAADPVVRRPHQRRGSGRRQDRGGSGRCERPGVGDADAFDGLLDVIERSRTGGVSSL